MEKICGIYKITSPSNRIYIGQANDIYYRWGDYKRLRCYSQRKLYNSLKKYGWEAHTFEIIDECLFEQLNEQEIYWGSFYGVFNSNKGLNLKECGGHKGRHCEETKKKIGDAHRGKIVSQKTKEKIRISHLGKKLPPCSEARKEKVRLALTGKKMSQDAINNNRKAQLGKKLSEQHKKNISIGGIGRKMSEESKKKISLSKMGKKLSEEAKQKMRGRIVSEETREKLRIANTGRIPSEETRRKMSDSGKGRIFSDTHKLNISKGLSGKPKSEEHRRKIGLLKIGNTYLKGFKHSEKSKKNMSIAQKKQTEKLRRFGELNVARMKKVIQINLINKEIINKFDSIALAFKATKIDRKSIINCCKNKAEKAGGYFWQYA